MDHETYRDLIGDQRILEMPSSDAVKLLGQVIDFCTDDKCIEGANWAIEIAKAMVERDLPPDESAVLNYFAANAWAIVHSRKPAEKRWEWEQEDLARQILYLRNALLGDGFEQLSSIRQCQVLVNLGNAMINVGRFVDAITYWKRAFEKDSSFAMAIGNLGMGFLTYGRHLHDQGHAALFIRRAHEELGRATELQLHPAAHAAFDKKRKEIEANAADGVLTADADWDGFSLGDSPEEIKYRRWCLKNVLFINPLNDLAARSIAAHDVFGAPSIAVSLGEGPYYAGFYDQMKQEYVSARFLLWEAGVQEGVHFADRGVRLYNTLDYPAYGLHVEKLKASYRLAYSILDKIVFFLNHYFALGCPSSRVSFRTIWYEKQDRSNRLLSQLAGKKNLPLRALFWLGLDLFSDEPGFRDSLEPEGRDIHVIRRHLEHKYLKLHLGDWSGHTQGVGLDDPLAYSVRTSEFEEKALKLLQLVRSALIYLSLSVYIEEVARAANRSPDEIVPGSQLTYWEDEWKAPL